MKPTHLALLVVLAACSRHSNRSEPTSNSPAAETVERGPKGNGGFGSRCRGEAECTAPASVCFHFKPKQGEQENRPEHGFCTMSCGSDSDCPSPPSSGHCNEKKRICTRMKGHGGQPGAGGQPGEAPQVGSGQPDEEEEEE